MLFCGIGTMDGARGWRANQYVGVRDERIVYIGDTPPREAFGERYDGAGRLLLPGLVNLHGHAPMTLLRGVAENLALDDWLHRKVFPFEARLDDEAVYRGAMLAAAEMLRFGTTAATEMYFIGGGCCRALLESGMKANVSTGIVGDAADTQQLPDNGQWHAVREQYHGAGGGRLQIEIGPHAVYTSTPRTIERIVQAARETGSRVHLHLAETQAEGQACRERYGKSPVQYFYDLGLFDQPATAAHCVWLEPADYALLAEKAVTVANCPVSNLKLASGFCPVPELLRQGISVGIGTDSVASNNSLNLFEEMKLFALLYKGTTGDPTAITPMQALYAATRAGALAQGRDDCGLLREGFRADLCVMDLHGAQMHPAHDPVGNLVYAGQGADVVLTMVDGRVLYRDGQYPLLDYEKIVRDAEQTAYAIAQSVNG